jgi:hypothetical protein
MMFVRPNMGNDWIKSARRFLKFMIEEKRWRRTWLVFGGRFMCVGVIDRYSLEDNDSNVRR